MSERKTSLEHMFGKGEVRERHSAGGILQSGPLKTLFTPASSVLGLYPDGDFPCQIQSGNLIPEMH